MTHNDLAGIEKKAQRAERRKAKKAAKKAALETGSGSDSQKAHPPVASDSQLAPKQGAEGHKLSPERRERLARELCKQYLYGHCRHGDACYRQHISLEELNRRAREGTGAKGTDKAAGGKPAATLPLAAPTRSAASPCWHTSTGGARASTM